MLGISVEPAVAKVDCYTAAEWPAFNVKVMQEMLQDAALQCKNVVGHNHDRDYNGLILRTQDQVRADGEVFRAHFQRVYGRAWEDKLDRFATRIENVAQSRSMASMTYCADSDVLFEDVQRATPTNLEIVAIDFNQAHFSGLSELGMACPSRKTPRIQTASKKSHHHKAKKLASAD